MGSVGESIIFDILLMLNVWDLIAGMVNMSLIAYMYPQ